MHGLFARSNFRVFLRLFKRLAILPDLGAGLCWAMISTRCVFLESDVYLYQSALLHCSQYCSSQGALSLAQRDAASAGIDLLVKYRLGDCQSWVLERSPTIVVANPPWGLRLHIEDSILPVALAESKATSGSSNSGSAGGRPYTGRSGTRAGTQYSTEPDGAVSETDLEESWMALSSFLRQQCGGAAYLFVTACFARTLQT